MQNHKAILGAALGVALLTTASPSLAAILYSNAPDLSSNQNSDCVYNTTCGAQFTGNTYGAQEFTLGTAAVVNIVDFNAQVEGSPAPSANWIFLAADGAGGLPGTVEASGTGATLTAVPGPAGANAGTTDYSFGVGSVALAAGTYYVAIQAVTSNFADYLSLGVAGTGAAKSDDGGSTWEFGYGGSGLEISSVAVTLESADAPPVPEPAVLALFGAAVAGLGFVRRRTRA